MKNGKYGICALVGLAGMVVGGLILKSKRPKEDSLTEQDIQEIDEMFEESE